MKTVGIAILFGLCCLIGIRLAAKKTTGLYTTRALLRDLGTFSDRVTAGATLSTAAETESGTFFDLLSAYLNALSSGSPQRSAAHEAAARMKDPEAARHGAELFFNGLSETSRTELFVRIDAFRETLARAEREAEETAKQAHVLKTAGVLIGAGLAILLL